MHYEKQAQLELLLGIADSIPADEALKKEIKHHAICTARNTTGEATPVYAGSYYMI